MNKKSLIFTAFLTILALPFFVSAQAGMNDCCKLRHRILVSGSGDFQKDAIVGSPDESSICDLDNDGVRDTGKPGVGHAIEEWAMICLIDTVMTVTDWIFYALMIVSVIMILFAAFSYITSAGDPTKASSALGIIKYAIIGIVIAMFAKIIPFVLKFILGM